MDSEDIDDPILVQGNIAQVEDEVKSEHDRKDKCNNMDERLETGLKAAEDQRGALVGFQESLGCMPLDAAESDGARVTADTCYEKFTLWGKCSATSGTLALSHKDIAQMVQREARKQAQQMFDQLRADLMFRPGSPSSIAAVSDVRDYVFPPETEVFSMASESSVVGAADGSQPPHSTGSSGGSSECPADTCDRRKAAPPTAADGAASAAAVGESATAADPHQQEQKQ
mmetsp:Transcript_55407/g.159318  ORF Transcript_55407/g.159318 Transcript_55407/m.159318 type:complete len:228 (-) Transcript_55407:294-977(-)